MNNRKKSFNNEESVIFPLKKYLVENSVRKMIEFFSFIRSKRILLTMFWLFQGIIFMNPWLVISNFGLFSGLQYFSSFQMFVVSVFSILDKNCFAGKKKNSDILSIGIVSFSSAAVICFQFSFVFCLSTFSFSIFYVSISKTQKNKTNPHLIYKSFIRWYIWCTTQTHKHHMKEIY